MLALLYQTCPAELTAAVIAAMFVSQPTETAPCCSSLKVSEQSRPLWEELPVQLGMRLMTRECLTDYTRDRGFVSEQNDGVVGSVREQVQEEKSSC